NWSAGVPTDIAGFNSASPLSISLSSNLALNEFLFNSGAAAYTITVPLLNQITFNGAGIVNNSGNTQTLTNLGVVNFNNSASAGNVTLNNNGANIEFNTSSTAGSAMIINNTGFSQFADSATAGTATIINNATVNTAGRVIFTNIASAQNATIV